MAAMARAAAAGRNSKFTTQAEAAKKKGEEALNRGMFSSMFSSVKKEEEAAENFKVAGQNYKLAKDYVSSVEMYKKAAANYAAAECPLDEMQAYDEMANSAKAGELFESCVEAVTKIIAIYQDNGKSERVPKKYLFLADLYHEAEKFDDEAEFLELAADAAEAENQEKFAQTQQLRRAKIMLHHTDKFSDAAKTFEKLGAVYIDDRVRKFQVPEIYMLATLCHLANGDNVAAQDGIESYKSLAYNFEDSRECKFVTQLVEHVEAQDADAYTEAVTKYDRVKKLDPMMTNVLWKIKKLIAKAEGEAEDADLM